MRCPLHGFGRRSGDFLYLGGVRPLVESLMAAHDSGKERMGSALAGMRRLTQWGLWFGGALVLLAALLIGVDVLMRKVLARSIGGADELAGYALAIGSAWGLGAALVDRAHIRIDSLYILFPGWLRIALDLAGLVLFIAFFALVTWHG